MSVFVALWDCALITRSDGSQRTARRRIAAARLDSVAFFSNSMSERVLKLFRIRLIVLLRISATAWGVSSLASYGMAARADQEPQRHWSFDHGKDVFDYSC